MRQLLLIPAFVAGLVPATADAQCPAVIPNPATQPDVACYTVNKPVNQRCATAIEPTVCTFLNNTARAQGLVTVDAYNFLQQIGFCAVVNDFGTGYRIYDFCPVGCFASDTQMLTSFDNGQASYAMASSIRPNNPMLAMGSDNLRHVVLESQQVKRIVYGAEDAALYVFTLANGKTLRVTSHHPMVLDNGTLVEAAQVDTSMAFVGHDGRSVEITSIGREKPTADVFNFETRATTQLGHIIVAEGVLVGDLKIQRELSDEQGSISLRR
jgi:hypothetical protein